jgi:hypothetical protein
MFMIISSFSIYFLELDNFMIGKRERRGELAKNSCYFPNIEEMKRLPKKAATASQT